MVKCSKTRENINLLKVADQIKYGLSWKIFSYPSHNSYLSGHIIILASFIFCIHTGAQTSVVRLCCLNMNVSAVNRRKAPLIKEQYSSTGRSRWGVSHICCAVCRPHLTHRQFETVVPTEDSVITEMTSTLRDWGAMWKQLFVVNTVWAQTAVRPQPDACFVNSGCSDAVGRNILFAFKLLLRGGLFVNYFYTRSLYLSATAK